MQSCCIAHAIQYVLFYAVYLTYMVYDTYIDYIGKCITYSTYVILCDMIIYSMEQKLTIDVFDSIPRLEKAGITHSYTFFGEHTSGAFGL